MPDERSHHKSKKRRYDIVLVPSDDAGQSKRWHRIAPWQMMVAIAGSVVVVVALVVATLMYTPVGPLVPIPNPQLENKYNRELLSLHQRMAALMEELLQLRVYNVKLRNALGERVEPADSGLLANRLPARRAEEPLLPAQEMQPRASQWALSQGQPFQRVGDSPRGSNAKVVSFPAILPTEGYLTQGFEPNQRHYGIDIAGKVGTPVNAAADGSVIFAGWTPQDGYMIILSNPGGFLTFYKHNQSLLTTGNSFMRRGEPVALLGNSGFTSSGPHLHFEIWKDGVPVDPSFYLINLNF